MGEKEIIVARHASFNSPIEIGTRAALILTVLNCKVSLDELVMFDYALLYSKEFGGPENLHPAMTNHVAEIAHRREYLPEAVQFFIKRGLMDLLIEKSGHYYRSNEHTLDFVSCLKANYFRKAWVRLNWLSENRQLIVNTNLIDLAKNKT